MVQPHLEYANSVWCSYKQGDIKELEKIRKRATKLVINLKKDPTLECGPMPNVMVALPNIGGALCSTPQSLADAHY